MADIITNTLQIGSNNLILRDADAQAKVAVNTQDISSLKEETTQILDSAYVTDTASGSVASFPDGADGMPVKSLKVNIEPVQDLHGYDSPWVGGGGKNLIPKPTWTERSSSGVTATLLDDGQVNVSGTGTNTGYEIIIYNQFTLSAGTYYFNGQNGVSNLLTLQLYNKTQDTQIINRDIASDYRFTLTESTSIEIRIGLRAGVNVTNATLSPMIRLSTVSDASFAPYENICPLSGHNTAKVTRIGKNFVPKPTWSELTSNSVTATLLDDGQVSVSGTGTNTGYAIIPYNTFTLSEGRYYFNGQNDADSTNKLLTLQLFNLDDNVTIINRDTAADFRFTLTKDTTVAIRIGLRVGVSVTNAIMSPMIRIASDIDPTFEPYSKQEVSINLGGTRYGGTLDVTTGVLTLDSGIVNLGTLTWNRQTINDGKHGFTAPINDIKAVSAATIKGKLYCSHYGTLTGNDVYLGNSGISMWSTQTKVAIYDPLKEGMTNTEFKTAMNSVQLVYEIAEPITRSLTPQEVTTLLGQNNIWNDCGDTEVEYRADTKLYIKKLTGSTEDDMVADANIVSGQYFMVGNTLYKATANIASGGAITPNVNCTRKSLPEALNEINA